MFEDSLVESQNRLASRSRSWIAIASLALQCAIAAAIVSLPLLHPEALPFHTIAPTVVVPVLRTRPVVKLEDRAQPTHSALLPSLPSVFAATHAAVLPTMALADPDLATGTPVPTSLTAMTTTGSAGDLFGPADTGSAHITVAPIRKAEPVRISAGVSSGMLLGAIQPVYPRIAMAARVEGIVIIEATISKFGTIESARVVSGPPMLRSAALEAVQHARYKPYRLNGEATEVQTTVTVNFRLGS